MLKICSNGHITGYRRCSFCGSETEPIRQNRGPDRAIDKRFKRKLTQAIRDAGGTPVADMRAGYWLQAGNNKLGRLRP